MKPSMADPHNIGIIIDIISDNIVLLSMTLLVLLMLSILLIILYHCIIDIASNFIHVISIIDIILNN